MLWIAASSWCFGQRGGANVVEHILGERLPKVWSSHVDWADFQGLFLAWDGKRLQQAS